MSTHWLEEMYENYKQDIFRFLFVLLKDTQVAEDALQETFLKAYLHQASYVHLQKEKAWLYQIARNTAYDMLRKRKRELPVEQEQINAALEEYVHQENGQSGDLCQKKVDDKFAYLEMIADLSTVEREIVSLKIIGGLTHKEIAKALHMTTASAKKRYERALNKLKEKYKEADENE